MGVECYGMDKRLKHPGHWGGPWAAWWELQCWQCHGPFCLLTAKDSPGLPALAFCLGVSQEGITGLHMFHPAPNSLPSSSWGGKGLRGA